MYTCICARVRDCEIRALIKRGAHDPDAIGDACGAGAGCGTCLAQIDDLIEAETRSETLASITG
jgi:bacterioferritin-associated ferredoxin